MRGHLRTLLALTLALLTLTACVSFTRTTGSPVEHTKELVAAAMERYDDDGLAATLEHYNSDANLDGERYVFIIDESGIIVAHFEPESVGIDVNTLVDSTGRNFGPDLVDTDERGRWTAYKRSNPATGQDQWKFVWVVRHGGLVFGSGWYER